MRVRCIVKDMLHEVRLRWTLFKKKTKHGSANKCCQSGLKHRNWISLESVIIIKFLALTPRHRQSTSRPSQASSLVTQTRMWPYLVRASIWSIAWPIVYRPQSRDTSSAHRTTIPRHIVTNRRPLRHSTSSTGRSRRRSHTHPRRRARPPRQRLSIRRLHPDL